MKKTIALLLVCALFIGGAFAVENIISFELGFPSVSEKLSVQESGIEVFGKTTLSGVSFGFDVTTMYSDLIGIQADISYSSLKKVKLEMGSGGISANLGEYKADLGNAFDISVGIAVRPYNKENLSIFIIPNVGYSVWLPPIDFAGDSFILLGAGCDASLLYKLSDHFGVNAGVDFDYYFTDLSDDTGADVSGKYFAPKIGLTITY